MRRTGLIKEETAITPNRHLVLLNILGNSEHGEYLLDGKRATFMRRRPGAVLFVPAGCSWKGWESGASTTAYLSLSIDSGFVSGFLGRTTPHPATPFSPDLGSEDPIIMNAARGIAAEMRDRSALSALLVESYAATIIAQLLRKQSHIPSPRRGGLATMSLNRVLEKIDNDPTANLSLLHLASLVGLSIPHFCRVFKERLGLPPHAYIVRQRVERAKGQLRHSSRSVTDIALDCGFSSSSHFSNAFRREVGTTPIDYRAFWQKGIIG